jgi:hypothetical protein
MSLCWQRWCWMNAPAVSPAVSRLTTSSDAGWGLSGLDRIEESWRDTVLWLLSGHTALFEVRGFYRHLRKTCSATAARSTPQNTRSVRCDDTCTTVRETQELPSSRVACSWYPRFATCWPRADGGCRDNSETGGGRRSKPCSRSPPWTLMPWSQLGSGRMVADLEVTISTTKHMVGTDAARFLSYLGRLVSLNASSDGPIAGEKPT